MYLFQRQTARNVPSAASLPTRLLSHSQAQASGLGLSQGGRVRACGPFSLAFQGWEQGNRRGGHSVGTQARHSDMAYGHNANLRINFPLGLFSGLHWLQKVRRIRRVWSVCMSTRETRCLRGWEDSPVVAFHASPHTIVRSHSPCPNMVVSISHPRGG